MLSVVHAGREVEVWMHLHPEEEVAVKRRVTQGLLWVLFIWPAPPGSCRLSHFVRGRAYKKLQVITNRSCWYKNIGGKKGGAELHVFAQWTQISKTEWPREARQAAALQLKPCRNRKPEQSSSGGVKKDADVCWDRLVVAGDLAHSRVLPADCRTMVPSFPPSTLLKPGTSEKRNPSGFCPTFLYFCFYNVNILNALDVCHSLCLARICH